MENDDGSALMVKRRGRVDSRNIMMTRNPLIPTAIRIYRWDVLDPRVRLETLDFEMLRRSRQL